MTVEALGSESFRRVRLNNSNRLNSHKAKSDLETMKPGLVDRSESQDSSERRLARLIHRADKTDSNREHGQASPLSVSNQTTNGD